MDIFLTLKRTNERLRIPLLPDRISIRTGSTAISYQIIKTGEAKIPRGSALTGYSWSGMFPGESMRNLPFVSDWQEPAKYIDLLKEWERNGEILNLMVTETTINADVFIETFTYDRFGVDHANYSISLTQYRELTLSTTPAPEIPTPETPQTASAEQGKKNSKSNQGSQNENLRKQQGMVVGGGCNVRAGPGTKYAVSQALSSGATVDIYEQNGNWYKISPDSEQWVCASYVRVGGSSGGTNSSSGGSSGTQNARSSTSNTATGGQTVTTGQPGEDVIDAAHNAASKTQVKSGGSGGGRARITSIAVR